MHAQCVGIKKTLVEVVEGQSKELSLTLLKNLFGPNMKEQFTLKKDGDLLRGLAANLKDS